MEAITQKTVFHTTPSNEYQQQSIFCKIEATCSIVLHRHMSHRTASPYVAFYCIITCCIVLHSHMLHRITLPYVTSYCIDTCRTVLQRHMLHRIATPHVVSYCNATCCIVLHLYMLHHITCDVLYSIACGIYKCF